MIDEIRHSERFVERLDDALLESTAERVIVSASSSQAAGADNPPPSVPEAEEPLESFLIQPTSLDRIQLPPDTEDHVSVASSESSDSNLTHQTQIR